MSLKWYLGPRLVALNAGTPVLAALVRRLTPDEAKDLTAQLPSLLQPRLRAQPAGPDKLITRETIKAELAQRLQVPRRLPRRFWRSSEPRSPRASARVR